MSSPITTHHTQCCVVGGGPAGILLAFLLARKGIDVTLLEAHTDFDRDFRGDSLNSSVMEILDELDLADRLLEIPHSKIRTLTIQTAKGPYTVTDYGRLKTRYPFIVLLPQHRFLEFMVQEARQFPNFRLVMNARVRELIQENGQTRGVVYQGSDGLHAVRTNLVVGADGRSSKIRQLAGLKPKKISAPMDVLWFRLPRLPGDKDFANLSVHVGRGYYFALMDRPDYWQISCVISKGTYRQFKENGLEAFKTSLTDLIPEFSNRMDDLTDWKQISFLSVESSRVPRWYLPGLLLIGDAAHVMSSVGGVGINCAIMDAVAAANILAEPLQSGQLREKHLARVQKTRMWPTRMTQMFQSLAQRNLVAKALNPDTAFQVPRSLRIPLLRDLAARVTAFGIFPAHVRKA